MKRCACSHALTEAARAWRAHVDSKTERRKPNAITATWSFVFADASSTARRFCFRPRNARDRVPQQNRNRENRKRTSFMSSRAVVVAEVSYRAQGLSGFSRCLLVTRSAVQRAKCGLKDATVVPPAPELCTRDFRRTTRKDAERAPLIVYAPTSV